jgi:glutathione synthase/RimK-type ligase-like ATP-grasp enzyme
MRKYNEVVSWPMSKGFTVKPSDLSVRSHPKLLPFFDEVGKNILPMRTTLSMARTLLVVDSLSDWNPYYPSDQVISFEDYLAREQEDTGCRERIINLCSSYSYLSDGYYCSLLAEARGHHVIPSVKTLNDLGKKALYQLQLEDLSQTLERVFKGENKTDEIKFLCFFGTTQEPAFQELARLLFERFSCPILEVALRGGQQWEIKDLRAVSHRNLDDANETLFATALDKFSNKVWRKSRTRKPARYDLAILVNPAETLPPSNQGALKKFIRVGREMGVEIELITKQQYGRLSEFDALFIRETTAIDHYTYRFAKKAEAEGLVVIDDPTSILRCTNKVYLADLFRTHQVSSPKTWILHKGNSQHLDKLESEAGFPVVIKIPDGSFSKGIVKVQNRRELEIKVAELFQKSALVLAQEYLYTEFDWRIGVFNNKALFACKYYMAKNHWQIYHHTQQHSDCGNFETLPTFEAPKCVLDAALKACHGVGNGLYGVDVKEKDSKCYVIEVNDNPNIDRGVEDKFLGDELYGQIMAEFLRRMENSSKGIM